MQKKCVPTLRVGQSKVTRVVYVVEAPITDRDVKRFGFANLQEAGFEVSVWQVAPIFLPGAEAVGVCQSTAVPTRRMTSLDDLRAASRDLRASDLLILLCGTLKSQLRPHQSLLAIVGRTPAVLSTIAAAEIPTPRPPSLLGHLRKKEFRIFAARVRDALISIPLATAFIRAYNRSRHQIRSLDFAWVGASGSALEPLLLSRHTKIRPIHAFDYDSVLSLRTPLPHPVGGAVFLDSMGPLHPDYVSLGSTDSRPLPEAYFGPIQRFLDSYEKKTGSRVRIAAHPRATPGLLESWYGQRPITYGDTVGSIASADLVIIPYNSTAVNLVVSLRKPCVFLGSSSFDLDMRPYVVSLAQMLRAPFLDLEEPFRAEDYQKIDETAYSDFMTRYVKKPGTPEAPFWDVVAKDIALTCDSVDTPLNGQRNPWP